MVVAILVQIHSLPNGGLSRHSAQDFVVVEKVAGDARNGGSQKIPQGKDKNSAHRLPRRIRHRAEDRKRKVLLARTGLEKDPHEQPQPRQSQRADNHRVKGEFQRIHRSRSIQTSGPLRSLYVKIPFTKIFSPHPLHSITLPAPSLLPAAPSPAILPSEEEISPKDS